MKIIFYRIGLLFLLIALFSSCIRLKDTVYLQGSIAKKLEDLEGQYRVEPADYLVKASDLLYIRVSSLDPNSTSFLNMGTSNDGASNALSASLMGYRVGLDGAIDFPYVGKIYVAGLSLSAIEEKVQLGVEKYVKQNSVTVKLLNDIITILGEVKSPGRFPLNSEEISIMEAIAFAGDLTDMGNRKRLRIIRNDGETPQMVIMDITDEKIMFSPFYYLKPGDIIYVEPKRLKQFNLSTTFISLFTSVTSLGIMVYTLVRTNNGN
ncbi:MAG: polysaccharide biosynthesis/export family protein [Cytophagaceae bacterium]|nr:polysaccharide biosynthesis/export family protein [Cytophagaceae bacterium]